jgi:4,5-DOPA dioxygenase extradiol
MISRRETLRMLASAAAAGVAAATTDALAGGKVLAGSPGERVPRLDRPRRMPTVFLAHGAPPLLDMPDWVGELRAWADGMPRPRAVLVLSAHWEQRPVTLGATRPVPLIYDFYGFPEHYYRQQYPAPGAPELAARVRALLAPHGPVADQPGRGLDHGAYVPLVAMYPAADVPVLQVSLPGLDPVALLALGQALAPLREEGVLLMGSGFITHNLRRVDPGEAPMVPTWASDFDAWAADALARWDVDALADFRRKGPGAGIALPTTEHFVPLLAAMAAASPAEGPPRFPISGFWLGSLTRRSVQWG